ncbi:MAG: type II toxin-antitoxin system prevent-host-death family antitoxin [Actinomycetota bacterium]
MGIDTAGDGDRSAVARAGIRELRNDVSALVRRAGAGERIVITVDGVPTAQLGPLTADAAGLTLEDLAAAGLIEPPGARPDPAMPAPLAVPADVRLDRLIDQVRGR